MAQTGVGIDIVERALAVLDEECRIWAARKRADPLAGEARPGSDGSDEPRVGDGR